MTSPRPADMSLTFMMINDRQEGEEGKMESESRLIAAARTHRVQGRGNEVVCRRINVSMGLMRVLH